MEGAHSLKYPRFRQKPCALCSIPALTQLLHCLNLITAHAATGLLLHQRAPLILFTLHTFPEEEGRSTMSCIKHPQEGRAPSYSLLSATPTHRSGVGGGDHAAGKRPDGTIPAFQPNSLFDGAGIWARGTLLAGVPIGARLGAVTLATDAGAVATAHQPIAGHACVGARGAVAVVTSPV